MRVLLLTFILITITACHKPTPVVYLQKGDSVVTCGGTQFNNYTASTAVLQDRGCIEDYKTQGYVRVER